MARGTKNECMHMERIVNKHYLALNTLKEADLTIAAIQTQHMPDTRGIVSMSIHVSAIELCVSTKFLATETNMMLLQTYRTKANKTC